MNPIDTNQASEDEVSLIPFEMVVLAHMELAYESTDEARRATESVVGMAKALIRTEKLKLLAEVRERVVGEDERIDIQSDYGKLDVPHLETDKYPGLDGVRQASRNLCRERQRAALTKLEAEL